MSDRLVWLLSRFELRARVFLAGPLSSEGRNPAAEGLGYLHILRSGSVEVCPQGGRAQTIERPAAFLFLNPQSHDIRPLSDEPTLVCATFEFGLGEGNPLQKALPDMFVLSGDDSPLLRSAFDQLFAEIDEEHCGRDAILERLCEVVLILILRDLMDRRLLDIGLLAGLADPKLARAINAIHAEPARDWTLKDLARVAGMSRARFAAHFHDVVGMTPGKYLADWRLGLAQTLLLRGVPVKTIAGDVGYGSASALSRVFSARLGRSPTAWLRARRRTSGQRSNAATRA